MREEEALKEDETGTEAVWLARLRDRARGVAKTETEATTSGRHLSPFAFYACDRVTIKQNL